MKSFTLLALIIAMTACGKSPSPVINTQATTMPGKQPLTYLALGDSYTIGEAVDLKQNFPNQLATQLTAAGYPTDAPAIIARTGWTTGELISAIEAGDTKGKTYDIVTLLIGVNNQYRGCSKEDYRKEFVQLLQTAIDYAGGNKAHVFVLSIPDWGVTPFANSRDRQQIAKEIDEFNAINAAETVSSGLSYTNITLISKKASADTNLTANDGLHPSAVMYSLWVEQLLPAVKSQLQ
ncbi:SGNH/GDSL hydrolase family protein [Mucilaginibacter terrenus]|uniref:SGNH/GDSL hydrolase family protein n=1 Tax=Mucilaginibacter terrenus TaxID=2482727 RepID=A0A3E2NJS9_9SPHI|nr:SGNH/GDSL hydrolase family protein [Mucilaginibacter terrenus]RFZ81191.1 SGNH/GDSL hydrolase family protein [Mucilaginibacter terrenus]